MSGSPAACARLISAARAAAHSVPGEYAALVQGQRHRKGLGFPGFAKNRPFGIAGNAGHGAGCMACCGEIHHAGSRYGSNASIETFSVGSRPGPTVLRLRIRRCRAIAGFRRRPSQLSPETPGSRGQRSTTPTWPAHIARQPGMGGRMNVFRAHAIARLELRGRRAPLRPNLPRTMMRSTSLQRELPRFSGFAGSSRVAGGDFVRRRRSLGNQHRLSSRAAISGNMNCRDKSARRRRLAIEARGSRCCMRRAAPIARTIAITRASHSA